MDAALNEMAKIGSFVLGNFWRTAPFLLVSVPLSVLFKHTGMRDRIRAAIDKGPVVAVALATVVGALSPFCSCSVIPLIAGLLASGVPLAPVMAFWLASPSMDPEILFMSAGVVGWELALWRLGATFAISFGAGLLTVVLERRGFLAAGVLRSSRIRGASATTVAAPERAAVTIGAASRVDLALAAAPAAGGVSTPAAALKRIDARVVARESLEILAKFTLLMILAFVLEALIMRFLPAEAVAALLGRSSRLAVPLATVVGIPLYTTNLSALGIVSGLLRQGMDGGAALAFLIGGAVTTIPAMSAVYGVVKPRVFALYLGFATAGALAAGYAFKLAHLFR
jgi:hypothetical protein